MNRIFKLSIVAFAMLLVIIIFGDSQYTDVIWLGIVLIGVLSLIILYFTEASEQGRTGLLSSSPRLILGVTSILVGILCLEPLYTAFVSENPSGTKNYLDFITVPISGLFLYVGFGWVRKAFATSAVETANQDEEPHE